MDLLIRSSLGSQLGQLSLLHLAPFDARAPSEVARRQEPIAHSLDGEVDNSRKAAEGDKGNHPDHHGGVGLILRENECAGGCFDMTFEALVAS